MPEEGQAPDSALPGPALVSSPRPEPGPPDDGRIARG